MDDITDELKQTVLYINRHTVAEVRLLALELRYADHEGVEILLPEVYGEESADEPRAPRQWDEPSFLRKLEEKHGKVEAQVAREVIEWARVQQLRFKWGTGAKDGSFIPVLDHADQEYFPFALWTYGKAEMKFGYLVARPPFDDEGLRREFLRRLNEIAGVSIPEDEIEGFPNIRLAELAASTEALDSFKGALDWFCDTVRGVQGDHADH